MSTAARRSLPQPPSWTTALLQQLRLLGVARRRGMLLFAALASVMLVLAAFNVRMLAIKGEPLPDGRTAVEVQWFGEAELGMPDAPGLMAFFLGFTVLVGGAFFWPLVVWRGEAAGCRDYHGSLPVSRPVHELARLAAGALWLFAAEGLMLAALVLGLLLSGRGGALAVPTWRGWLNFFLGPLILYLLVSLAPLLARRPGRAVLLAYLVLYGSFIFFLLVGIDPESFGVYAFITGELSFGMATAGAMFTDIGIGEIEDLGDAEWLWVGAGWLAAAVALVLLAVRRPRVARGARGRTSGAR